MLKKLLISLLIGTMVLGVGCGNKTVDCKHTTNNVEVSEIKEDEKREEFLKKAFEIVKSDIDDYKKKAVNDTFELRREDNIIIYNSNFSVDQTVSEMHQDALSAGAEGEEVMNYNAKLLRQSTVDTLSIYYDKIVEQLGDDYDFCVKTEKYLNGELTFIIKYDKDGYEFEYDLFEELGY